MPLQKAAIAGTAVEQVIHTSDGFSMWRPRPNWVTKGHIRSSLHIGTRPTWWIPIDGNGLFAYRRQDINAVVIPGELSLHPDFDEVYDQVFREESGKTGGMTNGDVLALQSYDINRLGVEENPTLHLNLQKTTFYRFYTACVDPRATESRTRHLSTFAPEGSPLQDIPNAVGISLIVESSDKKFLFALRSAKRVGPRKGEWDVSVVEAIHPHKDSNKKTKRVDILKAAARGLAEELGVYPSTNDIEILGFGVDLEYYQWNIIGLVRIKAEAESILAGRVQLAKDRHEHRNLQPVDSAPLATLDFLKTHSMWSSGLATVYYALVRLHGADAVNAAAATLFATKRAVNPVVLPTSTGTITMIDGVIHCSDPSLKTLTDELTASEWRVFYALWILQGKLISVDRLCTKVSRNPAKQLSPAALHKQVSNLRRKLELYSDRFVLPKANKMGNYQLTVRE